MIRQPDIVIPDKVDMPLTELCTSHNGVKIYSLPTMDFEVVRYTFVFRAGTSMQHEPFTASATANMLGEGTMQYTAQQIAEQLDFYGAYYDVNIDRDYVYISFCTLSRFFEPIADLASEVLLRPTFPEHELSVYKSKRKQELAIERKKVGTISRELFATALFGEEHPYGISTPESSYDDVTRADLQTLYKELYTANNCFVVCSGRIDTAVIERIKQIVMGLPEGMHPAVEFPQINTTKQLHHAIDGAIQSSIRIGRLLFPRTHPDFVGMQVLAAVLGGYFGSRLMQNLREERGYTYGVMAAMVNFDREGYLAIATQVACEVKDDALRQIYIEIERLRNELIDVNELQMVKNVMIGEILRILDGPFGISDVTIENIMCGVDNSYTEQNVESILRITPEELRTLAEKYLHREDLVEVVVG